MSTELFFGPETVDRPLIGGVVRENKAATAFIVGTAPIQEVHTTAEARAAYINKRIIIRRMSDIAAAFGPARAGYTLPQYLKSMFLQARARGIGTIVAVNVFDPDSHQAVGGQPDPSQVTNLDIIGGFDVAGQASGASLAYGCFQAFGWFPKIVGAPGFMNLPGVATGLAAIANRIKARVLRDAPLGTTVQQAIEARGPAGTFDWQTNSRREVLLMPHMMALDEDDASPTSGQLIPEPYSVRFAGVWLSSVMEYGYHHSPSNRPVLVDAAAQDILYVPGDPTGDTQLLRGAGIVTCEQSWGKGVHISGNRSAAFPTDTDPRNALHAQFIEDMLDEAILFYLDQWKDRNASPAAFDLQEDRINAFLGTKMSGNDPAIYGGRFRFDREATTPELVAQNWFKYSYDFMPVGVFERMTVTRWINIDYARDALALAQASDAPAGAAA